MTVASPPPVGQIDLWMNPLTVAQNLPVMPLALRGGPTLPVDLETLTRKQGSTVVCSSPARDAAIRRRAGIGRNQQVLALDVLRQGLQQQVVQFGPQAARAAVGTQDFSVQQSTNLASQDVSPGQLDHGDPLGSISLDRLLVDEDGPGLLLVEGEQ